MRKMGIGRAAATEGHYKDKRERICVECLGQWSSTVGTVLVIINYYYVLTPGILLLSGLSAAGSLL